MEIDMRHDNLGCSSFQVDSREVYQRKRGIHSRGVMNKFS